ncbi:MAG: hypothetical protein NT041_02635, partial [Candidatus Vogelbacteria bacterium]|nr:hypothetical protein [Candidatus Vogelbacteria bacterium]
MPENMLDVALPDVKGLLNDLLEKLSSEDGKMWLEQSKRFFRKEPCWTRSNRYLRQIATGVLGSTTGEKIFAEESEFFSGGLDSDFVGWLKGVKSAPTEEAPFEVLEQVEDGTFTQVLEGFGPSLDQLFLTEDQVVTFAKDHPELLHPKGYATFIPFFKKFDEGMESERIERFVALVRRNDDGQLRAHVCKLSDGHVWHAD